MIKAIKFNLIIYYQRNIIPIIEITIFMRHWSLDKIHIYIYMDKGVRQGYDTNMYNTEINYTCIIFVDFKVKLNIKIKLQ